MPRAINWSPRWLAGAIVAFSSAANPSAARGQTEIPSQPHLFLERSHFAPGNPVGKSLLFEGDAAAHYFLFNQFDYAWLRTGGWRFAMPVSFLPLVRMSTSTSSPVLTPSYRIRPLWLQAIHMSPEGTDWRAFRVIGISAGAMHYSNGQDGCTYLGFARDRDRDGEPCLPTDLALAERRVPNVRDGDFSTTFFPIALDIRRGRLERDSYRVATQWTLHLEGQIHPIGLKPGGIDRPLALEYGHHQIGATGDFEWRAGGKPRFLSKGGGMYRASVGAKYRTRLESGHTWSTATVEVARIYDAASALGWFVRGHFGGDYYNIHFKERDPVYTFGVIWDPGRIDQYNRTGSPWKAAPASEVEDRLAVHRTVERLSRQIMRMDAGQVGVLFSPDASLTVGAVTHRGRSQITTYFSDLFSQHQITDFRVSSERFTITGRSAREDGRYTQTEGGAASSSGQITIILIKQADGVWAISTLVMSVT